jgi:ribosomal protein S18 acetylase RimI-like enzyme
VLKFFDNAPKIGGPPSFVNNSVPFSLVENCRRAACICRTRSTALTLIEQNGVPAGTLSLSWQDDEYWGPQAPNAGYVHGLSIRDGFRGLGLGVYAINWCADVVRANGRQRLRLDCEQTNTSLCGYYESIGFMRVGTKPFPSGYCASLYELTIY